MTIQELRVQVAKKLNDASLMQIPWDMLDKEKKEWLVIRADQILSLDGLLIEVEGELPEMLESEFIEPPYSINPYSYDAAQKDMLKAGYKKVSPTKELLEEVSNERSR